MSEESDPLLPVLLEAVKAAENTVWRTNAMAKLPVRFPDGKYKNTPLTAGDPELLFTGVRAGKRADYIFEFEPVDDRPYKTVEMDESKVISLLPGFEALLVKTIGLSIHADGNFNGNSFGQMRAKFKIAQKKAAAAAEKERAAAAIVTDASRYTGHPLWGAF